MGVWVCQYLFANFFEIFCAFFSCFSVLCVIFYAVIPKSIRPNNVFPFIRSKKIFYTKRNTCPFHPTDSFIPLRRYQLKDFAITQKPSQPRFARQLSRRESPWQNYGSFRFSLSCQPNFPVAKGSPSGGAGEERSDETERAERKNLPAKHRCSAGRLITYLRPDQTIRLSPSICSGLSMPRIWIIVGAMSARRPPSRS